MQAAVVAAGSLGRGRRVLVRWTLQELAALYPGRSVEVRVPPFGATQIIAGSTHRRGTPPAVVECDTPTWCALATGLVTWEEAVLCGKVLASGQHTDLQERLPVGTLPRTCLF
ncbi:MAG: sterol carrier family protein [Actinomycetaceae bacterium]|nr:sterol carrier family protein [Actinomycetaceae bacterium]